MVDLKPLDPGRLEKLKEMGSQPSVADDTRLVRACFYGDLGVGKTTLAGRIAKVIGGPVCLINTDSAWTILQRDEELASRITRYKYDSQPQVRMIIQAHIEGIEPFASFRTIIWDTFTTSVDRSLRDLVRLKPETGGNHPDPSLEAYKHYRMSANSTKDTVDLLAESDLNVIYTGHVRQPTDKDKNDGKFAIRPNSPEANYNVVGQEVNLIGWLFKEKLPGGKFSRKIQTSGTTTETAKSQIPTIPEAILDQDRIPELIEKWIRN
jgi:hypothetical protein